MSDDLRALLSRAYVLHRAGHLENAIAACSQVLERHPRSFDALHLCGVATLQLGRYADGIALLEKAVKINGKDSRLWMNLGNGYQEASNYNKALYCYHKASRLDPKNEDVRYNLATCLLNAGQRNAAIEEFRKLIHVNPNRADVYTNLGNALITSGKSAEAVNCYNSAIQLDENFAEAYYNRANALMELGKYEQALADCNRAVSIKPNCPFVDGKRIDCHLKTCDLMKSAELAESVDVAVKAGKKILTPLVCLAITDDPATQQACARTWVDDACGKRSPLARKVRKKGGARTRLAYVSSDFRRHAVAHVLAGVLEAHDRSRFELIGISLSPSDASPMRHRIQATFDKFVDAEALGDLDVAGRMTDLGVDIAVNLNGHTKNARPGIFAYRPAPIQVNYLGYAGTLGADFIDYIVADELVVPRQYRSSYSESVVYMPNSFFPYDSQIAARDVFPTRKECGLPEVGFVFCSFNNHYKITSKMFSAWMRLLKQVEGSVLWLKGTEQATANLRRYAEASGVSGERLVFAPRVSLDEHLARHRAADLFLDTFPYNAHSTAGDALYSGLPVLTLRGRSFASRVASSLLTAIGMPELITDSVEDYVNTALRLAQDTNELSVLRNKLIENRFASPLFNCQSYTRHLETAYALMWERYHNGLPPGDISVAATATP